MINSKILYWTPRVLSILFICFLTMFSFDVFESGRSAGEIALAFLMHNIPSIILIILLVIAWKKEIVGAVAYLGAGLLYVGLVIYNVTIRACHGILAYHGTLQLRGLHLLLAFYFLLTG